MARTLPEGDPRYATDFLPRMDGAGCPPGGGAPQVHGGLGRALARNYVRRNSLEYSGLRGEGSTPGPLPPPARCSPSFAAVREVPTVSLQYAFSFPAIVCN
jgi:hypothetical protein